MLIYEVDNGITALYFLGFEKSLILLLALSEGTLTVASYILVIIEKIVNLRHKVVYESRVEFRNNSGTLNNDISVT